MSDFAQEHPPEAHSEWDWTGAIERRGDTWRVYRGDTGDEMIISEFGDRVGVKLIKADAAQALRQLHEEELAELRKASEA